MTSASDRRPTVSTGPDPFARDVARMLIVFFAVLLIDLLVLSLFTGKLRFWFPVWLDPAWAENPRSWVIYSQSYMAGIAFIPFLVYILDRDFLAGRAAALRALVWTVSLGTLGFIGWWKGGLMVAHGKEFEAVGWITLTVLLFSLVRVAEVLPARVARLGRRELLRGLAFGVSCFFLFMAVLDPLMQIVVQGMAWSSGLIIEIGFFVPAGIGLLLLSQRLRLAA